MIGKIAYKEIDGHKANLGKVLDFSSASVHPKVTRYIFSLPYTSNSINQDPNRLR